MGAFLVIIAAILAAELAIAWIIRKFGKRRWGGNPQTRATSPRPSRTIDARSATQPQPSPRRSGTPETSNPESPVLYRPTQSPRTGRPKIIFHDGNSREAEPGPEPTSNLAGLRDAFTGAQLNPALGLFRCSRCQVCYHRESYELLRRENRGNCVACSSNAITAVSAQAAPSTKWREYRPDVITLQDYRSHAGRVITFEGEIVEIRQSQTGGDYAALFEHSSWTKSLKLVFFRRYIARLGGPNFIFNLTHHKVRVRGLLVKHPVFGYEIIVSEKSMILNVQP